MEKIVRLENTNNKLCRQLLSLVDFSKGDNYEDTHISVRVFTDGLVVSTFCVNEYGSKYSDSNYTHINKPNIPFFTAKKLGII